jgi:hypothetical protein
VGNGCCFVCYHAGKGLVGPAKDAARAAVKAKIDSGKLKRSGDSGPRKAAPADTAADRRLRGLAEKAMHEEIRGGKGKTPAQVMAGMLPADIPVTIRLMVEISVRIVSIAG